MGFIFVVFVLIFLVLVASVKIVPQQQSWILERLGKYNKILEPGLSVIIPFVDKVAYKHTLKEQSIDVHAQTAISNDNVTLKIDGVLYVKIIDSVHASYGVDNPYYAITQLAQTTMRSEIGKLKLDKTFEEREALNLAIVSSINKAANNWGIQCMRYEIKDINPPETVLEAMELQVAAERQKRARILDSEGYRQAEINQAEGEKAKIVLNSEAAYTDQINRAKGEGEAILYVADATAKGIGTVASAITKEGGNEAVSLRVAEQYVETFGKLAQKGNTILLPSEVGTPSNFIAQAMTIFENIKQKNTVKKKEK